VVLEDEYNNALHVMDHADAEGFKAEWHARVIYGADHRERCHYCENIIGGQVIHSRDRTYCSFACLEKRSRPVQTRTISLDDLVKAFRACDGFGGFRVTLLPEDAARAIWAKLGGS
jgi:hypothetical protein